MKNDYMTFTFQPLLQYAIILPRGYTTNRCLKAGSVLRIVKAIQKIVLVR